MKRILKLLANALATLVVLPSYLFYLLSKTLIGSARAFPGWSQAYALLPGFTGMYLRRAFYRLVLPRCGQDVCLNFGIVFSHATAELGDRVYVGAYCCLGDVTLEEDVMLGSRVSVLNGPGQHGIARLDVPIREQPGVWTRIHIGRDSWIGEGAIVLADVGRQCVVAAGAVVQRPVPDFAIVTGNPARVVRFRNEQTAQVS
jgi:acetyltransferase-like isoleucine patch superfamily enzyme